MTHIFLRNISNLTEAASCMFLSFFNSRTCKAYKKIIITLVLPLNIHSCKKNVDIKESKHILPQNTQFTKFSSAEDL